MEVLGERSLINMDKGVSLLENRKMSTHITEIIPDDIPRWAKDAMDRGQLFNELVKRVEDARALAIGWAYADCCVTLDNGGDPRQTEMSAVLARAKVDLEIN